jgi:putative FmdB family regulatory protein
MPIYEYACQSCRRKSSLFVKGFSTTFVPRCQHCGSEEVRRLISRFAVVKSEQSREEGMDESAFDDLDENDPVSVARWSRRMKDELGEDMGPEFDEMLERMEAGETPDDMMGEEGGDDDLDL